MRVRYAFCGNRFFVLEAMLAAGLSVPHVAAVAGSYLERTLQEKRMPFTAIRNKRDFLSWFDTLTRETLITNGCPYIIPADRLSAERLCVNIHPSYLPDLRGADPVPGAILHGRDSGVTCHVIDAGVDTGDIIAQQRIAYSPEQDALRLYQESFQLEAEVFRMALARQFKRAFPQRPKGNEVYYSFKPEDLVIHFSEDAEAICRRVRAFNTPSKLARFTVEGAEIKIAAAEILSGDAPKARDNTLVRTDGRTLFVKKGAHLLRLDATADLPPLHAGLALD